MGVLINLQGRGSTGQIPSGPGSVSTLRLTDMHTQVSRKAPRQNPVPIGHITGRPHFFTLRGSGYVFRGNAKFQFIQTAEMYKMCIKKLASLKEEKIPILLGH